MTNGTRDKAHALEPDGLDTENEEHATEPDGLDTENEEHATEPDGLDTENEEHATEPAEQDPFDPSYLRIDPSGDLVEVKNVLVRVSVRKPHSQEYIRVHPSHDFRLDVTILEFQEDHESYLVDPAMRSELIDEIKQVRLYTTVATSKVLFLWPVPLPGLDGRRNPWHESAHRAAELAMDKWVRVRSNQSIGEYNVGVAEDLTIEPVWPDKSLRDLLQLAFNERRISSTDHPVVRRLRGRVP